MAEHINTFNKGANSDSTLQFQPDGTYRLAKNYMLTSYDANHYALEDKLSNRMLVKINSRYITNKTTFDKPPIPIGWFTAGEQIIVHSTNDETDPGGYGEIGIITFTRFENKVSAEYLPIYHHVDLKYTKQHMIGNEGFYYPENDTISRNYWTDNNTDPKVIDTLNPVFTTYFASGSIVNGDTYMVLQGVVEYPVASGTEYGPGMPNGNIFTGGATATYTDATAGSPTLLIIKYYPLALLSWQPSRLMGNTHFYEYGAGSVMCGSKIYFHRLGSKSDGFFTQWSYGSFPVHVGVANNITVPGNAYHNFVGDGDQVNLVNSNKSVKIQIDGIDTGYDTIQVACAEYDNIWNAVRLLSIVKEDSITGSTMIIEHTGADNLGPVTFDEVTTFPAVILKVKTMTTAKNYNIPANLTERQEITGFDKSTVVATQFEYPMPVHGDHDDCANGYVYADQGPILGADPVSGTIKPWSKYMVTGAGATVTYNAVVYGVGQAAGNVFTGVVGATTYTVTGVPVIRPCVSLNKYTPTAGGVRPNAFEIRSGGFWDYKDPMVAHVARGHWSWELYRYGLLFRDLKGLPFYVQHLTDYQFSKITTKGGLMRSDLFGAAEQWSLNPSLLSFSGIRLPKSITDQIGSFEIVRAERDPRIITQGLVTQVSQHGAGPIILTPLGSILASHDAYAISVDSFCYMIPDSLCSFPLPKSIGVDGDSLEEATWIRPLLWSAGTYYLRAGGPATEDTYAKIFEHAATDSGGVLRKRTFTDWENITEGTTVASWNAAGNDFYNYDLGVGGVGNILDNTCIGVGAANLDNRRAVGGKKVILTMSDFPHYTQYPAGYGYSGGGGFDATNPYKILMNYIKENPTPYGGGSDTALAATLYIGTGHFQEINSTILAEVETAPGSEIYEFNDVQIGGGDCFTCLIDYGYGLNDTGAYPGNTYSMGFYFPCECNANYNLRRGQKISNVGMGVGEAWAGGTGITYNTGGNTRLEDYSYNPGYSADGLHFSYPALPVDFKNAGRFPFRARFGGQKIPGETVDTYRIFRIDDYNDADGVLGEINNVRGDGDIILYWQQKGLGTFDILQRQTVAGASGAETNIGTGGVLDRFDTKSYYWGNQHTHGLTRTKYGWMWFDMRRKALLAIIGDAIKEISLEAGWQVFFNTTFIQNNAIGSENLIYNIDKPLMGTGIVGVYDPKYKVTYMTFKYFYTDNTLGVGEASIVSNDFTVAYDHQRNVMIGFFDTVPAIWIEHGDLVLLANNPKNQGKYYGADMLSTTFAVGDSIVNEGIEYVCILGLTITSYPGTAGQLPTAVGSIYWKKTSEQKEIYIENEIPMIASKTIGSFCGKVFDNVLEVVINPQSRLPFSVDQISRLSNNINYTSVQYDTIDQQITETIQTWDRNYEYKRRQWDHNVPFASNGRLEDFYLKAKFVKKNYDTDPTVPLNKQMVIRMIISKTRERE